MTAMDCGPTTTDVPTPLASSIDLEAKVGSIDNDIDLGLIAQDFYGENRPITDGAEIPLVGAESQGGSGTLLAIGVRASNLYVNQITFQASIEDPVSGRIRLDRRTIHLTPGNDGYAQSGLISNFSNLPVCPNQWSDQDLYGNAFTLSVSITDNRGREAHTDLTVVPQCEEGDVRCLCICQTGYELGSDCSEP